MDNIYIKANKKGKKKIGRWILLVIVLVLLFFGLFKGCQYTIRGINNIDSIKVKKINVKAPSIVSQKELIELSGIRSGQGILEVSTLSAQKKLSSHKWVKKAKVRRSLPSTINIDITPKKVKALAMINNELFYIDEDGKKIDKFTPGHYNDVIVINSKQENYPRAINSISELKKLEPVSELAIEQDVLSIYSSKFHFKVKVDIDNIDASLSKAFMVIKDLEDRGEKARTIDASLPGNKVVVIGKY